MLTNVTETPVAQLHSAVWNLKRQGYRLVTITCTDLGDAHDLLYHFDKNYELQHLRLRIPRGETLPSITELFFAAVLVENEIQDLFGLTVTGMVVDYKGRFLLSEGAPVAPLNKRVGVGVEIREMPSTGTGDGGKAS
jgi:ech hydrogenase subunit D